MERINSQEWEELKWDLFRERGQRCEHCGAVTALLEMHHKTYKRLGHELPKDLLLLCSACHPAADMKRARNGRARSKRALKRWREQRGYNDPVDQARP